MANVYEQFLTPSEPDQQQAVVPDQGGAIGPSGEVLNLQPNTGAANSYGDMPAPITNSTKNVYAQFLENEPKQPQQAKPVSASSNPYAQFLEQAQTDETTAPEQTGKLINLPAISSKEKQSPVEEAQQGRNPFENALRNFASSAATSTLNSIGGVVRYFNTLQQKDLKMAEDELTQAKADNAPQEQIDEIQSRINKFNEQIPEVKNAATQIADLSSQYPAAYGVSPTDQSISGQIGRGVGGVAAMIPAISAGPAGMALGGLQGASQAYESTYQGTIQELKNKGVTDDKQIQDEAEKSASLAAVRTLPELGVYMVGGKIASASVAKLISKQSPLIQGAVGSVAASLANTAAGATIRKFLGESAMPTAESLAQDVAFGLFHGVGTGVEAQQKKIELQRLKEKQDAIVGGPAQEVAPSSNPEVNKKEAEILASAEAQASVPEVTIPEAPKPVEEAPAPALASEAKAPAADLTSLILDQTLYDEGSAEWNKIQADIDALQKPAEAPAEAQPIQPNAIQEPSATEAMLRPQVTGQGEVVELSGVGEQKPEVPAKEAETPKEEVVVPAFLEEAKTPEEVDAYVKSQKEFWGKSRMGFDEGTRQRALKALGMQSAARKRQLTGNLTAKEQAAKDKREASNYVGKPVSVEGRNGTIIGNPFGRVKVRFSDGTESTHLPEKIETPVAKSTATEEKAPQVSEQKPEEVKPTLPQPVQDEFTAFARKQGGLNKAQAQKALIEYEKAGNIIIGDNGEMLFSKPENSTRESLRKAAGIEEKAPESKAKSLRDILYRFQNGEENEINTLKGLGEAVRDAANKSKSKVLADLATEIENAVDVGAEIGDAQELVNRAMAELEREAEGIEAPKGKKAPIPKKKTAKDKARDVLGDAAEGLSYILENKILDPVEYKRRVKTGLIEGGGEYDFFDKYKLPKKVKDLIFSKTGRPIDVISEDAGFKSPYEMLAAIDEAYRSAEKAKEETKAREKDQSDLEERLQKMKELEKTDPEAHAGAVEDDVRKELTRRLKNEGGYFTLPEIIYDAAVSVGRSIAKGARDFKSWSGEMVNRLGEGISNFLRRIYNAVSTGGGRFLERGAERGAIDITGEERFKPKPPTEQEAFAKKAADAMLKGRKTPITQDELANILARKFPGISPSEVSDLYATASGKPKAPAPYTGVAATTGETPEKISIRTKDQEDQVRRGILTSPVPAGEGTSRQEILNQGNANLQNGADPYQALERAKQGDFNALTTAKAYAQALAKQVSEALRKFGPESKEYKDLAKQYQDYYEGIREAGTVASDILRTFQGETDLSDAADIAREYTKITGEEPSLGKHEQIRKVADKVNKTIKESGEATQKVRDTLDESLSDVEVRTPESVEESQQQIADLSDAQGKKAKDEIDRLNNELEQSKKDLKEVRQAKATGQNAESLKAYYEGKLKDLQGQLESKPKFGKEVLDQAQKLVDKWKADRLEAEKLLTKQLAQLGSFPDVSIIGTIARIMRGHISELGLDFARSSKMIIDQFGPKAEKYLKEAWAKADALIKGEDGGEKAVKSVRKAKAKAKPVEKMTPADKAAESLRKRIAQAQKKIDDLNSGRVTTPKDVEKVTNDEIKRLESEYEQKKKDLADARLKAKQQDLFKKDKIGENLNPEQVKTLWETAKKFYLDKGESDWDKMVNDLASDLGLTPDQVRKGLASPKGARKASDEMYLKQRSRQIALDEAKRWLTNQKASWIGRVFGAAAEKTFKLAIFGHGTAFIGTHAPSTLYTNPKLAFKAWLKGLSYSFRGKNGRIQNIIDNKDLIYRPNWTVARRAGLENDPRETRREGATPARSDTALAKALDTISGGRGFDALFHLRQDMFDQAWNQLSVTMRTPEMAQMFAESINNATGFTKGGERTKGIIQSPVTKILFFAPKLIASRFKWLVQDPAKMLGTFTKMANPFTKVSPEERMSAIYEAKNKAKFLGMVTGTLLANQALLSVAGSNQSINFTDPKKNDWLAYKGFGYTLATIGAFTRITRLLAQEYNAVFGDLNRIQKARGGREAAMKDAIYTYLRSGFSPITRDIIVGATGKDYLGNIVPWSNEQPDRGRRKLTWKEIVQEQFAPIPLSEAATQKEPIPAIAKAASAAFFGTRLETPADIEEYEKSLKSRTRSGSKSNNILGGGSSRSSSSSGLIK